MQQITFWDIVRADLEVNTGHRKLSRAFTAFLFDPGFSTMFLHRIAQHLYRGRLRRLGIILWRRNIIRSGCHFSLKSDMAPGIFLPHPVGIVVGEGVRLASGVSLYQNVTIGKTASPQYPVIGEKATLYPNAVVIGPITIGARAVVGAGSIVVRDVPDDAIVAGNPAKVLRIAAKAEG